MQHRLPIAIALERSEFPIIGDQLSGRPALAAKGFAQHTAQAAVKAGIAVCMRRCNVPSGHVSNSTIARPLSRHDNTRRNSAALCRVRL